jgi:hypothetical protein
VTEKGKPDDFEGIFRILDPDKGDERITWDTRDFVQIREAKKLFLDLVSRQFKPYKVGVGGKVSANVMQKFDALAGEVVFLPPNIIKGG